MDKSRHDSGWWPRPILDREGQTAFWNRQATDYDVADMTRDNTGELEAVKGFCNSFVHSGFVAQDIVTLGGANGCRDPHVVMEALAAHGQKPQRINFNDLSQAMTDSARHGPLQIYKEQGIEVQVLPGAINEVSQYIEPMPRRVIIGVYRAQALIATYHEDGHDGSGLEEYMLNASILGSQFAFDAMSLDGGIYRDLGVGVGLRALSSPMWRETAQKVLACALTNDAVGAIRVVSQHDQKDGFFLSHWFVERNFTDLVRSSFSADRIGSIKMVRCPKGYVLCIDPVEPPRGIVTLLNNVVGNILPTEQKISLQSVNALTA